MSDTIQFSYIEGEKMTTIRSSNFSQGELNVLISSLEANRELALNENGSSMRNTEERRKEWKILTDLVNTVGNQNRQSQHVRAKWCDLKSRTRKKYLELKADKYKSDGKSLTELEKRILKLIGPEPELPLASWRKDILSQYESPYKMTVAKETSIQADKSLDNLDESSNQPDDSVNILTFSRENYSSDNDQRPSTSQEERNMSDDQEIEEPVQKFPLKLGSGKSLSFRINCHRKNKGSLLHEKIKNSIKTRNHTNATLTDIKSLLEESVKLQKQMLENQKLELMLLAKIADAELLYDD